METRTFMIDGYSPGKNGNAVPAKLPYIAVPFLPLHEMVQRQLEQAYYFSGFLYASGIDPKARAFHSLVMNLQYLRDWGTNARYRCELFTDFAPFSFAFSILDTTKTKGKNCYGQDCYEVRIAGGLIFHKSSLTWSIHT